MFLQTLVMFFETGLVNAEGTTLNLGYGTSNVSSNPCYQTFFDLFERVILCVI